MTTKTNTPRAGESAAQTNVRERGYVQRTEALTKEQKAALQAVLSGNDSNAVVVIPAANLRAGLTLRLVTNGLDGARINSDGDGV